MDQVDTLHGGRYWSKVSCCTITTHMADLEVKVMDLKILFESFWLICRWISLIPCMSVDIGLKFYAVPSHPSDLEVKVMGQF